MKQIYQPENIPSPEDRNYRVRPKRFNLLLIQLQQQDTSLYHTSQPEAQNSKAAAPLLCELLQDFPFKPQHTTQHALDSTHTLSCCYYDDGVIQHVGLDSSAQQTKPDIHTLIQSMPKKKLSAVQQIILILPAQLLIQQHTSLLDTYWLQLQEYMAKLPQQKLYVCISECQQIDNFSQHITPFLQANAPQILGASASQPHNQTADKLYSALNNNLQYYRQQVIQSLHNSNNNYHILQQLHSLQQLNYCQQSLLRLWQYHPAANIRGIYFCFGPAPGPTSTNVLTQGMWHDILAQQLGELDLDYPKSQSSSFLQRWWKKRKQIALQHPSAYRLRGILLSTIISLAALLFIFPKAQHTWIDYSTWHALQHSTQQPSFSDDQKFNYIMQGFARVKYAQQRYLNAAANTSSMQQRQYIIQSNLDQLILQTVIPYLQQCATSDLQTAIQQQRHHLSDHALIVAEPLFSALKIYLMLSQQAQHRDAAQITSWLSSRTQMSRNPLTSKQGKMIQQLVNTTLQTRYYTAWSSPQADLLQAARESIQQTPLANQALAVIANSYHPALNHNLYSLQTHADTLESSSQATPITVTPISPIYLQDQFNTVYQQVIPAAAQILLQQNWIINNPMSVFQNLVHNPDFTTAIEALYLQKYLETWQHQQQKLQHKIIGSVDNEHTIVMLLQQLMDKNSTTSQQIQQIILNTAPLPQATTYNQIIPPNFSSLVKSYSNLTSSSPLQQAIQDFIKKIHDLQQTQQKYPYLNFMLQRARHQSMLLQNIQHQGNTLADPYKQMLNHSLNQYYKLLLQKSSSEVEQAYQQQLYPKIKQKLLHLYPIDMQSKHQLPTKTFSNFFKRKGILDLFFEQYLSPLIDHSKARWHIKSYHGSRLHLSHQALINWQQTQNIKQQYFNKKNIIEYSFKIRPIRKTVTHPKLKLTLAGKDIKTIIKNQKTHDITVTWRSNSPQLSMVQTQYHAKPPIMLSYSTGPWSWLQLIRQANPVLLKKHMAAFSIYYVVEGKQLHHYIVTSQSRYTPFIHGLLGKAGFPASLIHIKS